MNRVLSPKMGAMGFRWLKGWVGGCNKEDPMLLDIACKDHAALLKGDFIECNLWYYGTVFLLI